MCRRVAKAVCACLALVGVFTPASADTYAPVVAPETLTNFGQLCEATNQAPIARIVLDAMADGWTLEADIQTELAAFRRERNAAREVNLPVPGSSLPMLLGETDWSEHMVSDTALSFTGVDGSLAVILPHAPVAIVEGIAYGSTHMCYLYGFGWAGADQIIAGLTPVLGQRGGGTLAAMEDDGRDFLRVSGTDQELTMFRFQGLPGEARPSFELRQAYLNDMVVPDAVRAVLRANGMAAAEARAVPIRAEVFGEALDICTSHRPFLEHRIALLEAAGWQETQWVPRNFIFSITTAATMLRRDRPAVDVVQNGLDATEWLLEDFRMDGPPRVFSRQGALHGERVVVILKEISRSFLRSYHPECAVLANFWVPTPPLLADQEPHASNGDIVEYLRYIYGPLGTTDDRDGEPLAPIHVIRLTTSSAEIQSGPIQLGAFTYLQTATNFYDAERLPYFIGSADPDPRGVE